MKQENVTPQQHKATHDEQILVVQRNTLFSAAAAWQGLKTDNMSHYLELIQQNKEFMPRSVMETDPTYKQIIPYLIFSHENKFFLMQRKSSASEQRLKSNYSLGIGGHMRAEDLANGSSIFEWAEREFHEEVIYNGTLKIEALGILNDDSNEVGKVHLGLVLLLKGDSPDIKVRSELKGGELVDLATCTRYREQLENWSRLIVPFLQP